MGELLSCRRCVSQAFSFGKTNPASLGTCVLLWWSIISGGGEGVYKEEGLPFLFFVVAPFLAYVKTILGTLTSAEWESTGIKFGTHLSPYQMSALSSFP